MDSQGWRLVPKVADETHSINNPYQFPSCDHLGAKCSTVVTRQWPRTLVKQNQGIKRLRVICNTLYKSFNVDCGLVGCTQPACHLRITHPEQTPTSVVAYVIATSVLLTHAHIFLDPLFWIQPRTAVIVFLYSALQELAEKNYKQYKKLQIVIQKHTSLDGDAETCQAHVFVDSLCAALDSIEIPSHWNSLGLDRESVVATLWYRDHVHTAQNAVTLVSNTPLDIPNEKQNVRNVQNLTLHQLLEKFSPALADKCTIVDPQATGNAEKDTYAPHWTLLQIQAGLGQKKVFQGVYHARSQSWREGTIVCQDQSASLLKGEIPVRGAINVNRALNGDSVAFVLRRGAPKSLATFEDSDEQEAPVPQTDDEPMTLQEVSKGFFFGVVVGILRRRQHEVAGTLRPLETHNEQDLAMYVARDRVLVPADPRIPLVVVRTRQSAELENMRILVAIDSWDASSYHPRGHWTTIIGPVGDRETETKVILSQHAIVSRPFPPIIYKELPPGDYTIPSSELAARLDMRDMWTCSIDPPGCTDIDDALSFEMLPDGVCQIGIHIADVTHFVRPGSAIDAEAADRACTVYLIDRRLEMLPSVLSSNLCSLVANKDRLAFSALVELNPDTAQVLNVSFNKSVIRSRHSYTYEAAQGVIDSESQEPHAVALRKLLAISKLLRQQRRDQGALEMASDQVSITLHANTSDPEALPKPTKITPYKLFPTNHLIEEFMLLANRVVAKQIVDVFPHIAVLRRHPPPNEAQLGALPSLLGPMEGASNITKHLHEGRLDLALTEVVKRGDKLFSHTFRVLLTRCMNQAVYFSAGDLPPHQHAHYGLACPLYTHFTSPIRRYPDILVHRLLAASIRFESLDDRLTEKHEMSALCTDLNSKYRSARLAGRASSQHFIFLYFQTHGPLVTVGVVLEVRERSALVFLGDYGAEGQIRIDPGVFDYGEESKTLKHKIHPITLSPFASVRVRVTAEATLRQ